MDGGHRAIKYTRVGGVKKEIYNEGDTSFFGPLNPRDFDLLRHPLQDTVVRDSHHLRRPRQTSQCRLSHRN